MMKGRIFIATLLLTFAFVIIHQTFVNEASIERQEIEKERKLKTNDAAYDVGSANKVQPAFSEWCHKYGKVYASDEVFIWWYRKNFTEWMFTTKMCDKLRNIMLYIGLANQPSPKEWTNMAT